MRLIGRVDATLREPPIATDWEGFVDNFDTTDWETAPITLPKESYTTDWEGGGRSTVTALYDRLGGGWESLRTHA